MKAIHYLRQIKTMDAKINSDIAELATLEALATKTTSVMGGERVQASGSQQKMADCVAKIVDMKEEINKAIDSYIDYKKEARGLLTRCEGDCITLLHKRYFEFKTWELIAVEMGKSYQWVAGDLHKKSLAQFQKILDEWEREKGCTVE